MTPILADIPAVLRYQRALDEFRRGAGDRELLLKRYSELLALLDFTTTLDALRSNDEIMSGALLSVMGELRATRGVFFGRDESGALRPRAVRGGPVPGAGAAYALPGAAKGDVIFRSDAPAAPIFAELGLEVVCPVRRGEGCVAAIGLGRRADGAAYEEEDLALLRAVAACAAAPIENGIAYQEIFRLNRKLQAKVFQLQNLFDLSRELTSSFDADAIKNVVTATLMGHLMISRCALFHAVARGFALAHERGTRIAEEHGEAFFTEAELRAAMPNGTSLPVSALAPGRLRECLERARLHFVVRLSAAGRDQGFFALGERVSRQPFGEEDQDFAMTLGRQGLAALEGVRLHRVRLEKERQDRELQIAREIQQSLFPRGNPSIEGFDVAAHSEACYAIGGDYYDFVSIPGGRVALVIADVSGKGTPASLLMASVHAWVQALAGSCSPSALIGRLNRFLFQNTQSNKYVTMFYAELDPRARLMRYVSAGHVPPFVAGPHGRTARLDVGGPALGLVEEHVEYEEGELRLGPGDVVAMVTDGATEAFTLADEEFGDERLAAALLRVSNSPAEGILEGLFSAVRDWTGPRGCSDDLTAVILKARP